MNEQDRRELDRVTQYQKELRDYLAILEGRIAELNRKLAQESSGPSPTTRAAPPPLPTPVSSPDLPPVTEKKIVLPPLPARPAAPPRTAPANPPPAPVKPASLSMPPE